MKFEDFIKALGDAGWVKTHDPQFTNIKVLHEKLFPCIAELESEIKDLESELETIYYDASVC